VVEVATGAGDASEGDFEATAGGAVETPDDEVFGVVVVHGDFQSKLSFS